MRNRVFQSKVLPRALQLLLPVILFWLPGLTAAAGVSMPGISINFGSGVAGDAEVATAVKILLALTILSLAPAILIVTTSFTRIVVVLSMLRHAFGMQQTPPNTVLISLALFLTVFSMMPSLRIMQEQAFKPFMEGRISSTQALDKGLVQMRDFMIKQTREQDLVLMVEVSRSQQPKTMEDLDTLLLIPAFMLSELKSAFQIGFVIFLPFLLIDIVVASILMSMGMLMVPPMMISLPIKILMFVLIDGWNLVVQSLMYSFS